MKLIWSESARQKRLEICRYIARDNYDAARRMNQLIKRAACGLLSFPQKGRIGIVSNTRELVIHPNYILIYTIADDVIEILAIVHAAQQYP